VEYTVKRVAEMTGVTVKALHHYHKIGLLLPCRVTETGCRLYCESELMRLQQILFYRELDFSLGNIKQALESESDRIRFLVQDGFHRNGLEDQQIGLSYYLLAAAEKFASMQAP